MNKKINLLVLSIMVGAVLFYMRLYVVKKPDATQVKHIVEPEVERSCEMARDIPRVVRALSPDIINHPTPLDKPVYIVTSFHTHPWEFGHTVEKHVGPRGRRRGDIVGDIQNADTRQLPAFAYDYDDSAGIKAPPFDINAATNSCIHGPERRPLP